jgi:hypothetical protein
MSTSSDSRPSSAASSIAPTQPSAGNPLLVGSLRGPHGGHPRVRAIVDAVVEINLPSFEPPDSLLRMVVHYAPEEPQLLLTISDTLYTQIVGTPRNGGPAKLAELRHRLVGRHISFRATPVRTRSTKPIFTPGDLHLDREPDLPIPYGPAFPPGEHIYFVGPADRQTVKIGTTYTLYERLIEQLQPYSVVPLVLYATRPGYTAEERAFHDRFAACRLRGEIFQVTGDLERWLDDEGMPDPLHLLTAGREISLEQNPPDLGAQLQGIASRPDRGQPPSSPPRPPRAARAAAARRF